VDPAFTTNMSSYFEKRLLEVMSDGLDDLLSQGVDQYEKEEVILDDGLNEILSQSFGMFEQKSLEDEAIDITDMFEVGGPSLLMGRRFQTAKGNRSEHLFVCLSFAFRSILISIYLCWQ